MDFKDQIFQISERIKNRKESVATEEATKMSFILPLITALGYDIYDPSEVVPEMSCDITKGTDRIDYAIIKDGKPIMLMECKHCTQNLDLHSRQLARYFVASKARFGVLTNGIEYRFYADLEKVNIMDEKPFLVVNMLDLSDADIEQMKLFHKSYYNESEIMNVANELKYATGIKDIFRNELQTPSSEFIQFFAKKVYTSGRIMDSVVKMFAPLVKKSMMSVINDVLSERLKEAMKAGEAQTGEEQSVSSSQQPNTIEANLPNKEKEIVTTQEELDGYNIVRAILRQYVDPSRVHYRNRKHYFLVCVDDWNLWWICRFYFKTRNKSIGFPPESGGDISYVDIERIDDIFAFADKLKKALDLAVTTADDWAARHSQK